MKELGIDNILQRERNIRVFISSTFGDMQAERDVLVKQVFPILRELCEQRNVSFVEVDLRWGITREEAEADRVLPICLEEIENCYPYFIGLLGQRYGKPLAHIPGALVEQYPWLNEYRDRSVTELEILHGVLNHRDTDVHAFFYFRDPAYLNTLPYSIDRTEFETADVALRQRLERLKSTIRQSQYSVNEYVNPVEVGELIKHDLQSLIEQRFPANDIPNLASQEEHAHHQFAEKHSENYIGNQRYFDRLDRFVKSDRLPLMITGAAGIGKSSLLASWVRHRSGEELQVEPGSDSKWSRLTNRLVHWLQAVIHHIRYRNHQQDEALLFAHFVSSSIESTIWTDLVRRIMVALKEEFDLSSEIPESPRELKIKFIGWLQSVAHKNKIVIVIDGLEQLDDREQALDLGWIPEEIPTNIRLILSTSGGPSLEEAKRRGWSIISLEPLKKNTRTLLASRYLTRFAKSLNDKEMTQVILPKQTGNPLFLQTILEELRIFGTFEKLSERIQYYVMAESPEELFSKVLERLESDYEETGHDLVKNSMQMLWAARQGLYESELLMLLGNGDMSLPSAIWSPFYLAIKSMLTQRSGKLTFSHLALKHAAENSYLSSSEQRQQAHGKLVNFFYQRPWSRHKIEEIPWHLAACKDWSGLYEFLAMPEYLDHAWESHNLEVKSYWTLLHTETQLSMCDAYAPILQAPQQYGRVVWHVCSLFGESGYYREALQLSTYLEEESRNTNNLDDLQASLSLQATYLKLLREPKHALNLLIKQEKICRILNNEFVLAANLGNQGVLLRDMNRTNEALRCLEKEERICKSINDLSGLSINQGNQGIIALELDELDKAFELFKVQERLCRMLGDIVNLQINQRHQGIIHYRRRNLDQALLLLKNAEDAFRKFGEPAALQGTLGDQVQVYLDLADYDNAWGLLEEREEISRQLEDPAALVGALLQKFDLFGFRLKQPDFALSSLKEAYQIALKNNLDDFVIEIQNQLEKYKMP